MSAKGFSELKFVRIAHLAWPIHIDGDEHGDAGYALTRAEWDAAHEQ